MQKNVKLKFVAAAVAMLAGGAAFAGTNFSISGQLNAGIEQYGLSSGTAAAAVSGTETRLSDNQSRIIFKGEQDVGGMKAFGQVDVRVNSDTNQATAYGLTAGNTGVGLSGGFGKVTMGRWDLHYTEGGASESARVVALQSNGTSGFVSQVNGVNVASATRTNNVLMYDTPNFGGITARVAYSPNPRATEGSSVAPATAATTTSSALPVGDAGGGSAWTTAIRYADGPLTAGLSYYSEDSEDRRANAVNADQRGTRAYVAYKFDFGLSVGLTLDKSKISAGATTANNQRWAERDAWLVPVKYSFGQHAVYAAVGGVSSATGDGTIANADTSASFAKIGYDYSIAKDFNIGVFYTQLKNGAAAKYNLYSLGSGGQTAVQAGQNPSQIYFGLSFLF